MASRCRPCRQGSHSAGRVRLTGHMRRRCCVAIGARSATDAVSQLKAAYFDVVCTVVEMLGEMDGAGLARWVRSNRPRVRVVFISSIITEKNLLQCADAIVP